MNVVAEFVVPARAVPGGETLAALPGATIRVERIIDEEGAPVPVFWLSGVDPDRFSERVRAEDGVADVRELVELDRATLFQASWTPAGEVVEGLAALEATVVDAEGTAEGWVFRVLADDRSQLRAFQGVFDAAGVAVELQRISGVTDDAGRECRLTPKQRRALGLAYERGYFELPRRVTQRELGAELGISGRAVSTRLRRGTRTLVASAVGDPPDDVRRP